MAGHHTCFCRYDEEREFYTAMLGSQTRPGKNYSISINFVGRLQDKLRGFYKSKYKNENDEEV